MYVGGGGYLVLIVFGRLLQETWKKILTGNILYIVPKVGRIEIVFTS